MIALLQAAGRVRRQFGDVVAEHGLGGSQYNVLRILKGADGALPTMTIRDRMVNPQPSITRLIDRLEERGLVTRVPSQDDRRKVDCRLTQHGYDLLDLLHDPIDQRDRELMSRLTEDELETLSTLLNKVGRTA